MLSQAQVIQIQIDARFFYATELNELIVKTSGCVDTSSKEYLRLNCIYKKDKALGYLIRIGNWSQTAYDLAYQLQGLIGIGGGGNPELDPNYFAANIVFIPAIGTSFANLGIGEPVFASVLGDTAFFRSLIAENGLNAYTDTEEIHFKLGGDLIEFTSIDLKNNAIEFIDTTSPYDTLHNFAKDNFHSLVGDATDVSEAFVTTARVLLSSDSLSNGNYGELRVRSFDVRLLLEKGGLTEKQILLSNSANVGISVTDSSDLIGLRYASDYSANNTGVNFNPRWIPDLGYSSGAFIQNQNSLNQVANFRIAGTGQIIGVGLFDDVSTTRYRIEPSAGAVVLSSLNTGGGFFTTINDAIQHVFRIQGVDKVRIDTVGNVGIGTSVPSSSLEVVGTNSAPNTSGSVINGAIRLSATGVTSTILDAGVNGSSNYSWLQSRSSTDYSVNRELRLSPNGGDVSVGANTSNYKTILGTIPGSNNIIYAECSSSTFVFGNQLIGAVYRGTSVSKSATLNNDPLVSFVGAGQVNSSSGGNGASITMTSSENWSLSARGTNISFNTVNNSTTSLTTKVVLFNSGNFVIQNGGSFSDGGFRLDVFGTSRFVGPNSAPATSGSTMNYAHRLVASGNNTALDSGVDGTNSYSWIQSRVNADFSQNRELRINPNGGNVIIGSTISTPLKQVHTAGATVTLANSTSNLYVNPAVLIASLTITLPSAPIDGQQIFISFGGTITTGAVVTTLSVVGNAGHTVLAGSKITTAQAGDGYILKFETSTNLWRIF